METVLLRLSGIAAQQRSPDGQEYVDEAVHQAVQ